MAEVPVADGWVETANGSFYEPGKAKDWGARAQVVRHYGESEEAKASGQKGMTWQEISDKTGPCVSSCQNYVNQWQTNGGFAPKPPCANPTTKMGFAEKCFLFDLYEQNPASQLADYKWHLLAGLGVEISEGQLCNIFQEMRLSLKKPEVRRRERFELLDGTANWASINYWHAFSAFVATLRSDRLVFFDEAALSSRWTLQMQKKTKDFLFETANIFL